MNWRKYSIKLPVYVSAGILISGTFWYLRDDPHIHGEDVVEIRAAAMERGVAFLEVPCIGIPI